MGFLTLASSPWATLDADYNRRRRSPLAAQPAAAGASPGLAAPTPPPAPPSLPPLVGPPNGQPQMGPEWMSAPTAPKPGDYVDPAGPKQQPGPWARLSQGLQNGSLFENPMLQMGLSLLGRARDGGDWAGVGQDMQQMNRERMLRQRLQNEERRQKVTEGRETEAYDRQRQLIDNWGAYVRSRPPEEQRELAFVDPLQGGEYLQRNRQIGIQERGIDLQLAQMDQSAREHRDQMALGWRRLDQDRILNSAQMVLGREEAARLGSDISRLNNWRMVDNDLARIEEILQRNPAAFNNLFDADVEVALARIRDPQMRADVQSIYSVATNLAREELRGQTPVSNIDMLAAVRGAPSPSSGARFAQDWLDRAYQDRRNLEQFVQSRVDYMQGGPDGQRTLFTPDETGRNYYQGREYQRYQQGGSFSGVSGATPSAPRTNTADAQGAAAALARREGTAGTVGGRAGAPRLLREPRTILERQALSDYSSALERGQTERARGLETRLRRAGLIP